MVQRCGSESPSSGPNAWGSTQTSSTMRSPSRWAFTPWKTKHGSISTQRICEVGPPSGMTPKRAPYEGSHRKPNSPSTPCTARSAASMSNTTGSSQKMTSRSVTAKSCIIVGPATCTSWLSRRAPDASATWYVRYGGAKPYPKKCSSPVSGSSLGCAVMAVVRRPP